MSGLPPPVYAAAVLRELVVTAFRNAVAAGTITAAVESPGDTSTPQERLPAILVRSARQRKSQMMRGQFIYTSVIEIELQAQAEAKTPEQAQSAAEALGLQIEQVFFTDPGLLAVIQAYPEINEQIRITSEGNLHSAELDVSWAIEVTERFWPPPGTPLAEVQANPPAPGDATAPASFDITVATS